MIGRKVETDMRLGLGKACSPQVHYVANLPINVDNSSWHQAQTQFQESR